MGGIYWLASYPKSGNTWLRVFLTNYWRNGDEPASINNLDGGHIASARGVFDEIAGVEASDLTPEEVDIYRPLVYERLAAEAEQPLFLKVHDAYTLNADQLPIMSPNATAGAVYVMRNPLDVAVSYAHHADSTVERMVERLCRDETNMCSNPGSLHNQLRQILLTWSQHVESWVDQTDFKVHVVRYEDMVSMPEETFGNILKFLYGWSEQARLKKALSFSSFNRLKAQETEIGFKERASHNQTFFRRGQTGSWRSELNAEQAARLISALAPVMHRFGYLDDKRNPTY